MLDFLFKNICFVEPQGRQFLDLGVRDGKIAFLQTADSNPYPDHKRCINAPNLHAAFGFCDIGTTLNEPGNEHKDTIQHLSAAAAAGGFTELVVLPVTSPPPNSPNTLQALRQITASVPTTIHLLAHTFTSQGISEMRTLSELGAIAFTTADRRPDLPLLYTTLQYLKTFDGLLVYYPDNFAFGAAGQMHEGKTSLRLGLEGMPALAEKISIAQILDLAAYFDSKIHVANVSTVAGLKLIAAAKAKGLRVSCGIAAYQVSFEEESLENYDPNFKVNPPFRSREDIEALQTGLKNGLIDVISSGHYPQDIDSKRVEFNLAEFGILGLETAFACTSTFNQNLTMGQMVEKMAYAPRRLMGLKIPQLKLGEKVSLCFFDPKSEWTFRASDIASLSQNTPFINRSFKGKVVGVLNGRFSSF